MKIKYLQSILVLLYLASFLYGQCDECDDGISIEGMYHADPADSYVHGYINTTTVVNIKITLTGENAPNGDYDLSGYPIGIFGGMSLSYPVSLFPTQATQCGTCPLGFEQADDDADGIQIIGGWILKFILKVLITNLEC